MNPTVSGPWRNGEKIFKMSSIPLTYSNKNFENCDTNPLCHGQRRVSNSPSCAEYRGASQIRRNRNQMGLIYEKEGPTSS